MDYVDFVGSVLAATAALSDDSADAMMVGVRPDQIEGKLSANAVGLDRAHEQAIGWALVDLEQLGLVRQQRSKKSRGMGFFTINPDGRRAASDPSPWWETICSEQLEPRHEELLGVVNRLSTRDHPGSPAPAFVFGEQIAAELGWPQGIQMVWAVGRELVQSRLVVDQSTIGQIRLRANYRGLVWETRRSSTGETKRIRALVAYGETTSVDLKRDVDTRTKDQKAELIKDLLGLANTQATPPHLLLIGFDDKTRVYHGAPNARLTQEHLEQLVEQYTSPILGVRYRVFDLPWGRVGEIEVARERVKLPYRVGVSVGDKKRIEVGTIFVRHGSLTVPATLDEEAAIRDEGDRAREADGAI